MAEPEQVASPSAGRKLRCAAPVPKRSIASWALRAHRAAGLVLRQVGPPCLQACRQGRLAVPVRGVIVTVAGDRTTQVVARRGRKRHGVPPCEVPGRRPPAGPSPAWCNAAACRRGGDDVQMACRSLRAVLGALVRTLSPGAIWKPGSGQPPWSRMRSRAFRWPEEAVPAFSCALAPRPARPGWHRPRAGAPGRVTARPPWPGCGSRSPRRGPRPAPTCVPARPAPAARRHGDPRSTRRSRRAAAIRSLIVTRPACQPRSGNWTP